MKGINFVTSGRAYKSQAVNGQSYTVSALEYAGRHNNTTTPW